MSVVRIDDFFGLPHVGEFSSPDLVRFATFGFEIELSSGLSTPGRVWVEAVPVGIASIEATPNFPRFVHYERA